jgi:nucleotide-binding universal stress UspA family protein
MKKILVAVDLSSATVQVCNAARDLARDLHAHLVIAHVVPPEPLVMKSYVFSAAQKANFAREAKKRAADRLGLLAKWFRKSIPETETVQHAGPVVPTLLRTVGRLRPDYLVVGSHGHSAAYEMLVGSVAHGLIRQAPCPVMLVPVRARSRGQRPRAETTPAELMATLR